MSMLTDMHAYVIGVSAVSALISNRLYPLFVPQDATLPAVAYQVISTNRELAHQKAANKDGVTGLTTMRVQFTISAATYSSARAVADALRGALHGYSGTMGSTTVYRGAHESENDGYNTDGTQFTVRADWMCQFREV